MKITGFCKVTSAVTRLGMDRVQSVITTAGIMPSQSGRMRVRYLCRSRLLEYIYVTIFTLQLR